MSNHIMSKVGENHEAKIRGEMSPSRSKVVLCLSYRRLIHCILNDDTRKTESLGLNRTMFFHGDACEFFGRDELIRMYSESSMQLHMRSHSNQNMNLNSGYSQEEANGRHDEMKG